MSEESTKFEKLDKLLKKSICNASSLIEKDCEPISISPKWDDLCGGLLPGTLSIFAGKYKTGKTSLCLHIAKKLQGAGYKIYFCNAEHRLSKRDLKQNGLDLSEEKFQIIQSSDDAILYGEDFIAIADHKLNTEKNVAVLIDSFSQLSSKDLVDADIRDRYRDSIPLLLAQKKKKMGNSGVLKVNNNIILGITHEIADQNPYTRTTKMEASGNKIQYACDYKFRIITSQPYEEPGGIHGLKINLECVTSPISIPKRQAELVYIFNEGIDEVGELLDLAIETGIVDKRGNWHYFSENDKYHGRGATLEHMRSWSPKQTLALQKQVRERLEG